MKRGFAGFIIMLVLCSSFAFAATPYSSSSGYHPLQQVTTDQTGATSVDANSNGIIDTADSTGTFTGDSVGSGTTDVTFKVKGGTNLWTSIDFYNGAGAYWGMGKSKAFGDYRDNDFYIDRSGVRRALTIDASTLNVGIDNDNPQQKLDVNGNIKGTQLCIGADCREAWPGSLSGGSTNYLSKWTSASTLGNSAIYDNGNVGIGTTTPNVKLQVAGDIKLSGSNPTLTFDYPSSAQTIYFRDTIGGGTANIYTSGNTLSLGANGQGNPHITILNSGNVGIGTVSPAVKFHISETGAHAYQYITAIGSYQPVIHLGSDYGGAGVKWGTITVDTLGNLKLLSGGSLSSPGISVNPSGNVGIGTTDPQVKLQVMGGIYSNSASDATGGFYYGSANSGLIIGKYSVAPWPGTNGLYVGGNTYLAASSGNVGIGTTNPGAKLDVTGNIINSNPSSGSLGLTGDLPGYTAGVYPTLKTSGSWMYFSAGGLYSGYWGDGGLRTRAFYDFDNENYYVNPASTSNLYAVSAYTRAAAFNMPYDSFTRRDYVSDTNYWTGTKGWSNTYTWANAWSGGAGFYDNWGSDMDHPQNGAGYTHAQGIISGLHYNGGGTGYGWMMVGAHAATENRYWLRGKWGGSVSGWVEMITTGNIGSQSVNYASSAGTADTVSTPSGNYKHLGEWGVGRTANGAILVNTAYYADSAGYASSAGSAATVTSGGSVTTEYVNSQGAVSGGLSGASNNLYGIYGMGRDGGYFYGTRYGVNVNSCNGCSVLAEMVPVAETPKNGDVMCTNPNTGTTEVCREDKSDYLKGIAQQKAEQIMRLGCAKTLDTKNGSNSMGIGVMDTEAWKKAPECNGWYPIALSGLSEETNVVCKSPSGKPLGYGDKLVTSSDPGKLRPLDKGEEVVSYEIAGKADSICAAGKETDSIKVWIQ